MCIQLWECSPWTQEFKGYKIQDDLSREAVENTPFTAPSQLLLPCQQAKPIFRDWRSTHSLLWNIWQFVQDIYVDQKGASLPSFQKYLHFFFSFFLNLTIEIVGIIWKFGHENIIQS